MGCRRLLLYGLVNARDLGGFKTKEGKITKFNQYVRSEELSELSNSDIEALIDYGIKHCIDLRSHKQIKNNPSPINNIITRIQYHVVDADTSFSERNEKHMFVKTFNPATWADILFGMLDNQSVWMGKSVELLSSCGSGVLFNCNSGRNRSNLLALIVLSIAKVPYEDIVADYATNEIYLKEFYKRHYSDGSHPASFFETPSYVMEDVIQRVLKKYGSFEDYLYYCGVSSDCIRRIYHTIV